MDSSSVESASRCGGMSSVQRTRDELLTAMKKGAYLLKHGRSGRPKVHFFRLSLDGKELRWRSSKSGTVRAVPLAQVQTILMGQSSELFRRYPLYTSAGSFSLRYQVIETSASGKQKVSWRSLDLTCAETISFDTWYYGLQIAIKEEQERLLNDKTLLHENLQSLDGESGFSDVFVWGRFMADSPARDQYEESKMTSKHHQTSRRILLPQTVPGNAYVNPSQVSVASRHLAVVTKQGKAFMQGDGIKGQLGQGHTHDLYTLSKITDIGISSSIDSIACGDEYSAFVTDEGDLYMCGKIPGIEQALMPLPTRINISASVIPKLRVRQVSCGPFHWAVVADGKAWTAGDGWGGKLGHGDFENRSQPSLVTALPDSPVLSISCGVWHTACIVEADIEDIHHLSQKTHVQSLSAGSSSPLGRFHHRRSGSAASFGSAIEVAAKMVFNNSGENCSGFCNALERMDYHEGRGGVLYTWGGVNSAVTPSCEDSSIINHVRDSNKGCLGHGDEDVQLGQLLPKKVRGALLGCPVRFVATGLNLTVVCTTNGLVYQMGATGASPAKNSSPWEGATRPTLVEGALAGQFVDSISCGMHHVAAIARQTDRKTGRPQSLSESNGSVVSNNIFTWGRGDQGQLGTGKPEDSAAPVLVDAVRGRDILSVACGGATTAVLLRHDGQKWELAGGKDEGEKVCKALGSLLARRTATHPNILKGASFRRFSLTSAREDQICTKWKDQSSVMSNLSRASTSSQTSSISGFESLSQRSGTATIISISSSPTSSTQSLSCHPARSSSNLGSIRLSDSALYAYPRNTWPHLNLREPTGSYKADTNEVELSKYNSVSSQSDRSKEIHSSCRSGVSHPSNRPKDSVLDDGFIDSQLQDPGPSLLRFQVEDSARAFRENFLKEINENTQKAQLSCCRVDGPCQHKDSRTECLQDLDNEIITSQNANQNLRNFDDMNSSMAYVDEQEAEESGNGFDDGERLRNVLIERKQELLHHKEIVVEWAGQLNRTKCAEDADSESGTKTKLDSIAENSSLLLEETDDEMKVVYKMDTLRQTENTSLERKSQDFESLTPQKFPIINLEGKEESEWYTPDAKTCVNKNGSVGSNAVLSDSNIDVDINPASIFQTPASVLDRTRNDWQLEGTMEVSTTLKYGDKEDNECDDHDDEMASKIVDCSENFEDFSSPQRNGGKWKTLIGNPKSEPRSFCPNIDFDADSECTTTGGEHENSPIEVSSSYLKGQEDVDANANGTRTVFQTLVHFARNFRWVG